MVTPAFADISKTYDINRLFPPTLSDDINIFMVVYIDKLITLI
jgi:hypothetical protein